MPPLITRAGVREFEDLRRIGAVEAYRRMPAAGCAPDTRMLWRWTAQSRAALTATSPPPGNKN
ncbi:TfoX/Sxy family DNA transformation protein [Nocardia sp. NPDC004568]|uniref:TfoX/Sxy family DNA transformation protein n=1 Tax=Nocardia sp. NPDC004568 TaxID=3154551 RepID=UPI0033A3F372